MALLLRLLLVATDSAARRSTVATLRGGRKFFFRYWRLQKASKVARHCHVKHGRHVTRGSIHPSIAHTRAAARQYHAMPMARRGGERVAGWLARVARRRAPTASAGLEPPCLLARSACSLCVRSVHSFESSTPSLWHRQDAGLQPGKSSTSAQQRPPPLQASPRADLHAPALWLQLRRQTQLAPRRWPNGLRSLPTPKYPRGCSFTPCTCTCSYCILAHFYGRAAAELSFSEGVSRTFTRVREAVSF